MQFVNQLLAPSAPEASIPDGQRVYAIGDIHGCDCLLQTMLRQIARDARSRDHGNRVHWRIVLLGDYIDRGPDSRAVLERLCRLKLQRPETVFLKGNHEAALLDFLDDPVENMAWLEWGGEETLRSYGINPRAADDVEDLARSLRLAIPAHHLAFLKDLAVRFEFGDYIFVHAGLRPGVPLDEQTEYDQLWIRKEFHNARRNQRPENRVVVHGHQSAEKVIDKGWRICVDTGAVWTGTLTAAVLQDTSKRFVSVASEADQPAMAASRPF